jgi:hypothetical protein
MDGLKGPADTQLGKTVLASAVGYSGLFGPALAQFDSRPFSADGRARHAEGGGGRKKYYWLLRRTSDAVIFEYQARPESSEHFS